SGLGAQHRVVDREEEAAFKRTLQVLLRAAEPMKDDLGLDAAQDRDHVAGGPSRMDRQDLVSRIACPPRHGGEHQSLLRSYLFIQGHVVQTHLAHISRLCEAIPECIELVSM